MSNFYETVQSSADYILSHCPLRPTCGVVLGSGLGGLVDSMEDKTVLPYADIPHFPAPLWQATPETWSLAAWRGKQ